jgi:hypothetical protein
MGGRSKFHEVFPTALIPGQKCQVGVRIVSAAVLLVPRFSGNINLTTKNRADIGFATSFVELNCPKQVPVVRNSQRIVFILNCGLDEVGDAICAV